MRVKLLCTLSFLFFILFSIQSNAGCTANGVMSFYMNAGDVYVQRDTPVGTELKSFSIGESGTWSGCTTDWTDRYELATFSQSTSFSKVWQTNVPGVGFKFYSSVFNSYMPFDATVAGGTHKTWDTVTVTLVKVGDITSGQLTPGAILAKESVANYAYFAQYVVPSGVNIKQLACSITTPNLTFQIGDIPASSFGTAVGTIPSGAQNTQNLGLNCDANANINVSLQGTQNPDVSTTSVLALTGQGNSDVANGVGVQLVYNGSPLVLNNRIVLKQSAGGQETFPITARYYQTKTAVTAGKANASATLDLTYQ
ncbi:fimbrial protein [Enterobacter sp. CC120223-11]|uniref:fimbrial protein n=1 Tax=Enterobacter sp. CC120223-11 TaxID=1378073 RepID=UPI000BD478FD|nr:fimbrial protein [Enterobacter sp. CC120223-11]SNY71431.1 Pilin (type 1 fimbria component protein) [Enterobacter sp. CC120223-11]